MAEYIEREKAFKLIKEQKEKETGAYSRGKNRGLIIAGSIMNNKEVLPTADVVEVKHGTWNKGTELSGSIYAHCSACNRKNEQLLLWICTLSLVWRKNGRKE